MTEDIMEVIGLDRIPPSWDKRYSKNLENMSKPLYEVEAHLDVWMTLSDGTRICMDIYRPVGVERCPALLSWSAYSKSMQALKRGGLPPESLLFDHSLEAGDIDFFVKRGYMFVIPDPRGIGKSEGEFYGVYNPQEFKDVAEVIDWLGQSEGCDGNVGMIGFSYFGIIQMLAAAQQPKYLKCIMPLSFVDDYYQHGHYGGVLHTYMSIYWELCPSHRAVPWSLKMYGEEVVKEKMKACLQDKDIAINSYFSKILNTWPPNYHTFYLDYLLHPEDCLYWRQRSAQEIYDQVKVPVYLNSAWSPNGRWSAPVFNAYNSDKLAVPKKVSMSNYDELELPYRCMNEECLRWYDHWLKNVDTGLMDEPPLKLDIIGAGYRYEHEWPLARTKWKKLFLRTFGKLKWEADPESDLEPDSFNHLPPNITAQVDSLVYTSPRLTRPMEFTGPLELHLFAAIDAEDANFIVKVWNIFPDGSRHPLSIYGALRASHRLVPEKSTIGSPVHDNTVKVPVTPGEIKEYVIEISPAGMVFPPGHRISLEIKAMDPSEFQHKAWTGKVGNMGPIPAAKTTNYKIYRDARYPSYLLLPYIPYTPQENWLQTFE